LAAAAAVCDSWPAHTLRVERFASDRTRRPARRTPFEVVLARSGITVSVTPDISVLDALNRAGVELLSSCRRGVCGTCETTVLEGRPDHRDTLLDEEDETADHMYVCVSRSRDDRLVLDL
jgi:ferredoxin